jgi:NAD(P)-dependent dehydrogenase (short-subunit alcohol dehydrogenase family)
MGTSLDGRVALVTGGGRGIGRAISLALAAAGASVAVNYHKDEESAFRTVADIEEAGGHAAPYRASVDSWDDDAAMVEAVSRDFGPVDILVNNAGIASRGLNVADTDPAELERVLRTHAFGAHFLCKLVVPAMRTRPRGDIIMISSMATTLMAGKGAPYNMAKAALEALALTLAKEEGPHGIRVNTVAPGLVVTEMGDRLAKAIWGVPDASDLDAGALFGRVCRPDDVAHAVMFLVSDNAFCVTGQRIAVDGGGAPGRDVDQSGGGPSRRDRNSSRT